LLKRKKDPLRKTFEILYSVRLLKDRVSRIQSRLDDRASELSERLVQLQMHGDKYLASRYAEEVANLRKLSSRLSMLMYVLDKVDLAVQHAIVRREFSSLASELSGLIKDVGKLPESRIPDLGILFADLEASVRELTDIVSYDLPGPSYNPPANSEVSRIIEEAKATLREKLEPVH